MGIKTIIRKRLRFFQGLWSYIRFCYLGEKAYTKMYYNDLYNLSYFSKSEFIKTKNKVVEFNKKRISAKPTCRVGFVVFSLSIWTVDRLYKLLDKDPKFEVSVLVVPVSPAMNTISKETLDYFMKGGYHVETLQDSNFNIEDYDILLYTHPYTVHLVISDLHLNKLATYVSYSYMLADKIEKLDLPLYLLSWKYFCDSDFYKNLVETKSRVYTNNAVFCGYPKMDDFYIHNDAKGEYCFNKKVIIYAPHHSVNRQGVKSATIEKNGWYLLYLAEKYKDEIFWIIKPHPELRYSSVAAGLFKNTSGYDYYLQKWEETGSAKVVENGDYFGVFHESDAMITDSVSFLAEYQFTGKPLLLLESGKQTYNDFGNQIRDILYRRAGNDYNGIDLFIKDVINGIDSMKEKRVDFFQKNLYHNGEESELACDKIYEIFKEEFTA